jgi:hypothetical protein
MDKFQFQMSTIHHPTSDDFNVVFIGAGNIMFGAAVIGIHVMESSG